MSDPEELPRYGNPDSPVIVQLVRAILLAGLRARALEMRLEWRDRPATFQALLDLGEPPARPELIHTADERDAPPTGGWAVVHVFSLGAQQVTLVPPSKLWWVVKHRLLCLAGVTDDPAAGYRTDEYDGAMRVELVSSNGEEVIGLRFERVPGGEHVVLNWG